MVSSSVYIINDIFDASHDRQHPIKKNRPIASNAIKIEFAMIESFILFLTSVYISFTLGELFTIIIVTYFTTQILYSAFLKKIAVIDIIVIASGFILRVYGGGFVINAHLSVWFLLCAISLSLFLASGKRRAELSLVQTKGITTRPTLLKYKKELLNSYVTMFGNAAWMSWSLFTFLNPQKPLPIWVVMAEISKTITINKLLMVTIPFVIFGIMRYEKLIFEDKTEGPEKLLLTDIPLIFSVIIWFTIVMLVLYGGLGTNL